MKPRKPSLALWIVPAICLGAANAEIRYTVTDVSNLGGYETRPGLINNLGQMAGVYRLPTDPLSSLGHAFFYDGSSVTELLPGELGGFESTVADLNDLGHVIGSARNQPPGTGSNYGYPFLFDGTNTADLTPKIGESIVTGINVHGQIVGLSSTDRAFLYDGTGIRELGDLGGVYSSASAMNDVGQVVGEASLANGHIHAFSYNSSTGMRDLGALGFRFSRAWAINNAGEVVGEFSIDVEDHPDTPEYAFYWSESTGMIGLPAGTNSAASAINDRGEIVGIGHPGFHTLPYAWYSDGNNIFDLNTLIDPTGGWKLWSASDINNLGQIIGVGQYDPDGPGGVEPSFRAFLLTPIPEPTAAAALAASILILGSRRR